ncbi:PilZ domain-containing protein [Chitinimonas sp. BJYL2]|uniref:PilZ domain-containing protein n=1 Tax=Chitinimonas sp. BJYL2 TaxID=2976696 RepID=UPI0022B4C5C0|nr:PilZ domain-containing protein [Chitinimonas sp. BJYL2]
MTTPLSIRFAMPISWLDSPPVTTIDPVLLLRVLALLEASPAHLDDDDSPDALRWQSLEARVELMLQMVGQLLARGDCLPPLQEIELSGAGVSWNSVSPVPVGKAGYVGIYLSPRIPQPLVLSATIRECELTGSGDYRLDATFEQIDAEVQDWIEKTVFRRHRRQIFEKKHPHDD